MEDEINAVGFSIWTYRNFPINLILFTWGIHGSADRLLVYDSVCG